MSLVLGGYLVKAKKKLPHGEFQPWVRAEFEFSVRTAERWMDLARLQNSDKRWARLNPDVFSKLAAKNTPESAREEALNRLKKGEKLTMADAKALIREHRQKRPEAAAAKTSSRTAKANQPAVKVTIAKKLRQMFEEKSGVAGTDVFWAKMRRDEEEDSFVIVAVKPSI